MRKGPITPLFPDEEADLVRMAGRSLVPIAGDWSGGVLVLDMSGGNVETAPVISFSSEGGIVVLGQSFDDFLALLASLPERGAEMQSLAGRRRGPHVGSSSTRPLGAMGGR